MTLVGLALFGCEAPIAAHPEIPTQDGAALAYLASATGPGVIRSPAGGGKFTAIEPLPDNNLVYLGGDVSGVMWYDTVTHDFNNITDGLGTVWINDLAVTPAGYNRYIFAATHDGLYRRGLDMDAKPSGPWRLSTVITAADTIPSIYDQWSPLLSTTYWDITQPWGFSPTAPTDGLGVWGYSVRVVTIDPKNPSHVWVGLGDGKEMYPSLIHREPRPFLVYRSTDAGGTFEPVMSLFLDPGFTDPSSRLLVGPSVTDIIVWDETSGDETLDASSDLVLVATDSGLWKGTGPEEPAATMTWTEVGGPTDFVGTKMSLAHSVATPLRTNDMGTGPEHVWMPALTFSNCADARPDPDGLPYTCITGSSKRFHPIVTAAAVGAAAAGSTEVYRLFATVFDETSTFYPLTEGATANSGLWISDDGGDTWVKDTDLPSESHAYGRACSTCGLVWSASISGPLWYSDILASQTDADVYAVAVSCQERAVHGGAYHSAAGWSFDAGTTFRSEAKAPASILYDGPLGAADADPTALSQAGIMQLGDADIDGGEFYQSTDRGVIHHQVFLGADPFFAGNQLFETHATVGAYDSSLSSTSTDAYWDPPATGAVRSEGPSTLVVTGPVIQDGPNTFLAAWDFGVGLSKDSGSTWTNVSAASTAGSLTLAGPNIVGVAGYTAVYATRALPDLWGPLFTVDPGVYDVAADASRIYAASETGLYVASTALTAPVPTGTPVAVASIRSVEVYTAGATSYVWYYQYGTHRIGAVRYSPAFLDYGLAPMLPAAGDLTMMRVVGDQIFVGVQTGLASRLFVRPANNFVAMCPSDLTKYWCEIDLGHKAAGGSPATGLYTLQDATATSGTRAMYTAGGNLASDRAESYLAPLDIVADPTAPTTSAMMTVAGSGCIDTLANFCNPQGWFLLRRPGPSGAWARAAAFEGVDPRSALVPLKSGAFSYISGRMYLSTSGGLVYFTP